MEVFFSDEEVVKVYIHEWVNPLILELILIVGRARLLKI